MTAILLYDGECGFCSQVVSTVLRHERQRTLYFAALQSPLAATLLRQQAHIQQLDSVLWIDLDEAMVPQRTLQRSAATLRLFAYLGGWWHALRLGWLIPRPWRDALYDVVARNRHRLLRHTACALPTATERRRFLYAADDLTATQRV
jgi:predicted DCC family thiol-disulfide oxidoreductase YuxK